MLLRERSYPKLARLADLFPILIILAIAGYLRFIHLDSNPGWYTDEGTWAIFAHNVNNGPNVYLGILNSNFLFAKLPLFSFLGSLVMAFGGSGIPAMRTLTAGLGTFNVLLVFVVARWSGFEHARLLAPVAAFLYASFGDAVIFSRMGFSYNLLATFVLLEIWGALNFIRSNQTRWLVISGIALGLGIITDVMGLLFLPVTLIIVIMKRWRKLAWFVPLVILPFAIYALFMLVTARQAMLFDLQFTFFRVGKYPLAETITLTWIDFYILLIHNYWVLPGIAGLFLLQPVRWRYLVLFIFFTPLILLFRTVSLSELAIYYMIPFWPLVCIGLASFIYTASIHLVRTFNEIISDLYSRWNGARLKNQKIIQYAKALVIILAIAFFLFIPLVLNLVNVAIQADVGFPQAFMGTLVNPEDARAAAKFVNDNRKPNDLVIASPAVASLVTGRTADFQTAMAYTGIATEHLPGDIPRERYAYASGFDDAAFVITDPIWTNWAIKEMLQLDAIYNQVQSWPVEYRINDIIVYRNPNH